jgi:hypothetical protein
MEQTVLQLFITMLAIPITLILFQRFVNKADETKKEEEKNWRNNVTGMFERIEKKITSYCAENHKEHDELYTSRNILEKRVTVIENTHHLRGCDDPYSRRSGDGL